ncbi:hypothetical protein BgiMline_031380, partial [Biomphalaria glabrata]
INHKVWIRCLLVSDKPQKPHKDESIRYLIEHVFNRPSYHIAGNGVDRTNYQNLS